MSNQAKPVHRIDPSNIFTEDAKKAMMKAKLGEHLLHAIREAFPDASNEELGEILAKEMGAGIGGR